MLFVINRTTSIHRIARDSIKDLSKEEKLGEGAFGSCWKKKYRDHVVAVKYFTSHTRKADIEHEARMINGFDHPGNYISLLLIFIVLELYCIVYMIPVRLSYLYEFGTKMSFQYDYRYELVPV